MRRSKIAVTAATLLLATTICAAELPAYIANKESSSVTFTGSQEGVAFTGNFSEFSARIVFDPENLTASRISANVSTASANTDNEDRDTLLVGDDWFASLLWPTAAFVSTSITPTDQAGELFATGNLTLRNTTQEVRLTFSITDSATQPEAKLFKGSMQLQRLGFGVGQGDWADTRWVANEVAVNISLLLVPE